MTKRSAMLVAAGLVAALLGGATALSFGLSGSGTAQAETPSPDPIVRTVHRTVTVEKDAKGQQQPVQVVRVTSDPAPSTAVSSTDASYEGSDDAYEHESDEASEHESDEGYEDGHEASSGPSSTDHSNGEGGYEDD
jgi:hypothetical protein